MKLSHLISLFLLALEERGVSQNTLRAYRQDLKAFAAFAPAGWSKVRASHIESFVTREGFAQATQSRRKSALSSFCKWLEAEGLRCPSASESPQRVSLLEMEAYQLTEGDHELLAATRHPNRLALALQLVVARASHLASRLSRPPRIIDRVRGSTAGLGS